MSRRGSKSCVTMRLIWAPLAQLVEHSAVTPAITCIIMRVCTVYCSPKGRRFEPVIERRFCDRHSKNENDGPAAAQSDRQTTPVWPATPPAPHTCASCMRTHTTKQGTNKQHIVFSFRAQLSSVCGVEGYQRWSIPEYNTGDSPPHYTVDYPVDTFPVNYRHLHQKWSLHENIKTWKHENWM